MTAEVVELRPGITYLARQEKPRSRMKDVVLTIDETVRGWVLGLPVVIVRRKAMEQREIAAFELGRECERYLR